MCYPRNMESLPTFGIKTLRTQLRGEGLSLGDLETSPPGSWDCIKMSLIWRRRDYHNGEAVFFSVEICLRRDQRGLYLDIYRGDLHLGESYRLVRRESNLKPGTFRYYFVDPFTWGRVSLCEKLYLLPDVGEFVPRSVLSSHRVRYSQQRKGHSDRYYSVSRHIPEGKELKYRKTHYRGKETPFWRRLRELQEERDYKITEYTVGTGIGSGIFSPEIESRLRESYLKHTGRKALPLPLSLYRTRKSSTRRVKVPKIA